MYLSRLFIRGIPPFATVIGHKLLGALALHLWAAGCTVCFVWPCTRGWLRTRGSAVSQGPREGCLGKQGYLDPAWRALRRFLQKAQEQGGPAHAGLRFMGLSLWEWPLPFKQGWCLRTISGCGHGAPGDTRGHLGQTFSRLPSPGVQLCSCLCFRLSVHVTSSQWPAAPRRQSHPSLACLPA